MTTQFINCTEKTDQKDFKKRIRIAAIAFTLLIIPTVIPSAWGGSQVGTLTEVQGTVKIFSHPSNTLQPKQGIPHALFEGEYFLVADAQVGSLVEKGNIVRTAPGAKAHVIYPNGDQIHIGSGTAYRIHWNEDSDQAKTQVNLMYGKLRGIIEKGGPRSHLQIRTKTAVMGVRGTDFFIAGGGSDGSTEISVIRGSVEVTPNTLQKKPKPVEIATGYSADIHIDRAFSTKPTSKVDLRKTTQEDLMGIQKSSKVEPPKVPVKLDIETQKTVEILQKKASETTLKDIQKSDKELYSALEKQGNQLLNLDQVNQASLQNLLKVAPKAPPKRKPYKSELEDIDDGAYERYFKNFGN